MKTNLEEGIIWVARRGDQPRIGEVLSQQDVRVMARDFLNAAGLPDAMRPFRRTRFYRVALSVVGDHLLHAQLAKKHT